MIFIISSCTNSKKIVAEPSLSISNFSDQFSIKEASEKWNSIIKQNDFESCLARELYKGVAWQYSLKTHKLLSTHLPSKLLVASAGYGLIEADQTISSYDSTFTSNTKNSVSKFKNYSSIHSNILWWNSINKFSINDFPNNSRLFIILPFNYLLATQTFIHELVNRFKDKVFIFTASQKPMPILINPYIIKFDSRFDTFHKGVKSTLLQRATHWLVNEIVNHNLSLTHTVLQTHIDKTLENYEKIEIPIRKKISENEIKSQIISMVTENKVNSASVGLRFFRENGFACEQKRFSRLFNEVKGSIL